MSSGRQQHHPSQLHPSQLHPEQHLPGQQHPAVAPWSHSQPHLAWAQYPLLQPVPAYPLPPLPQTPMCAPAAMASPVPVPTLHRNFEGPNFHVPYHATPDAPPNMWAGAHDKYALAGHANNPLAVHTNNHPLVDANNLLAHGNNHPLHLAAHMNHPHAAHNNNPLAHASNIGLCGGGAYAMPPAHANNPLGGHANTPQLGAHEKYATHHRGAATHMNNPMHPNDLQQHMAAQGMHGPMAALPAVHPHTNTTLQQQQFYVPGPTAPPTRDGSAGLGGNLGGNLEWDHPSS